MVKIFVLLLFFVISSYSYTLKRVVIARDIKNREPIQIDSVFSTVQDTAVYCFTEFKDILKDTYVFHRWFYRGKLVRQTELPIKKSVRWRTWSIKRLYNFKGQWEVEIADENKKRIGFIRFFVN